MNNFGDNKIETVESLTQQIKITDDLEALLNVLPPHIKEVLVAANEGEKLIEIVMDLGRQPEARHTNREILLSEREVSQEDIDYVIYWVKEYYGERGITSYDGKKAIYQGTTVMED